MAFFAFALVAVSSPFATVAQVPLDGNGSTPSLQNPYMMAHPPLLYLGYVGFAHPVRVRHGGAALGRRPTSAGSR